MFGFYETTGIDLPAEGTGIFHTDPSVIDMSCLSFGESATVTPIQLINSYCAIVNGGNLMVPHVVRYITDENGNIVELICSVDLTSKSGSEGANRKVKGTLHWVSEIDAKEIEVRLYEPILLEETEAAAETETEENGEEAAPVKADFIDRLNPDSLKVIRALAEPAIADAEVGAKFQFLRMGYFCKDPDSTEENPVYNRTVALKDSWAKAQK
jgi:hypothetical protein